MKLLRLNRSSLLLPFVFRFSAFAIVILTFLVAGLPWPKVIGVSGHKTVTQLKDQGLSASLQEAVAAARYGVYAEPQGLASWRAENPLQNMSARFTAEGVQLVGRGSVKGNWRTGMTLSSVGYGERAVGVSAARPTVAGSRIEYRRSLQGRDREAVTITEWYVNRQAGLEQGFTLESAPCERKDGEWLRLTLALDGDLRAQAMGDGKSLEFLDGAGTRVLRYDHLVVTDGHGRELEARMTVAGDEVWLEVDDREAVWPVTIDPTFAQAQKLVAPDAAEYDNFGVSVAVNGETVVVGAYHDDGAAGIDQGSAYVFLHSGGLWSLQQKLLASDAEGHALFGRVVAISGETIVVGAPPQVINIGEGGWAYVFVRGGGVWTQQQKLEAPDPVQAAAFGFTVAISGETVVVGAMLDAGGGGIYPGSSYVFVRSAGHWNLQQKLQASDAAHEDWFGYAVAISGETLVVGASRDGENQGSAYVFERTGGVWTQQQKLEASDAAEDDRFGDSVAISGETLVVGADHDGELQGSAYVFVRTGGVWTQQQKLEASDGEEIDGFGGSVAINGETVVVGTNLQGNAAYLFVRSGGVWTQVQELEASDATNNDGFGASVAISGEIVVIGAPGDDVGAFGDPLHEENTGSAYVFVPGIDLSLTKSGAPDPVSAGNNVSFTLNVTNIGSGTATNVQITDNLPAGTTFVSCAPSTGGLCGGAGNNQTITFPSLAQDEVASVTLVAKVNCNVVNGALINNIAAVTLEEPDLVVANNTAQDSFLVSNPVPQITCPADIDVFSDPGQAFATLNPGTATATDPGGCPVVIVGTRSDGQPLNATYPAGITLITWKATDAANQIATCVQTIKVRTTADVRVVIDPLINPIKVGKFLTYRVEIINHGPSPAIGVRLTDTIDSKEIFVGIVAGPGVGACSYNPTTRVASCEMGTINQSAAKYALITVKLQFTGWTANFASASVDPYLTLDPNLSNNTFTKNANVLP